MKKLKEFLLDEKILYKDLTYLNIANIFDLKVDEVYGLCYKLHKEGKINKDLIHRKTKFEVKSKIEDQIIDMYYEYNQKEIADKLNIETQKVISCINILKKAGILVNKKLKEDEKSKRQFEMNKAIDREYDLKAEKIMNKLKKERKKNEKKIGDEIEVYLSGTDRGLTLKATIIKIYKRFYLYKTEDGWLGCEMKG